MQRQLEAPGSSTNRGGSCRWEIRGGVAFGASRPGATVPWRESEIPCKIPCKVPCKKGVLWPIFLDNFLYGSAPPAFAGMLPRPL